MGKCLNKADIYTALEKGGLEEFNGAPNGWAIEHFFGADSLSCCISILSIKTDPKDMPDSIEVEIEKELTAMNMYNILMLLRPDEFDFTDNSQTTLRFWWD